MIEHIRARRGRAWISAIVLTAVLIALGACAQSQANPSQSPAAMVIGTVTAGPVCPVEQMPPASACAPRPVAGAVLVLSNSDQGAVTRATTGPDGRYSITVHGAGTYTLTPQPVQGLLGTPAPVRMILNPGVTTRVDLQYDTGIR